MLFNSIEFAFFLPVVFLLYWFATQKSVRHQNILILLASCFFYGWWDWRFLTLIFASTIVDFFIGSSLQSSTNVIIRKWLLRTSLIFNLGLLIVFKYLNFFVDSFVEAFTFFGSSLEISHLSIVLPVGISFYTFQTLSYTIDIYNKKLDATKDFVSFAAFVTFFPQLVAGPIEKAANLLPQFFTKRKFDYLKATDGMRQILWGLFKKVVIADNCGLYADLIFGDYMDLSGSTLLLGALFFTFQIYCDFSGYSDIAVGTARLFGFNLLQNFRFPYFSRDIAEFWRRWHISLNNWFRDYLYIPLGGSRVGNVLKIRNIFIVFLVSGLWHGANWTYIAWGFLNALYFLPIMLTKNNKNHLDGISTGRIFPKLSEFLKIITTFSLTVFAWIFFRSETIVDSFGYLKRLFSPSILSVPSGFGGYEAVWTILLVLMFVVIEWIGRNGNYAIESLANQKSNFIRYLSYTVIIIIIFLFSGDSQQFIYFNF